MNNDQRIWIVGSFLHFACDEGFTALKGYDLSAADAKGMMAGACVCACLYCAAASVVLHTALPHTPLPSSYSTRTPLHLHTFSGLSGKTPLHIVQATKAPLPAPDADALTRVGRPSDPLVCVRGALIAVDGMGPGRLHASCFEEEERVRTTTEPTTTKYYTINRCGRPSGRPIWSKRTRPSASRACTQAIGGMCMHT